MPAVLFAALAGALFGALAVAVRSGLRRGGDPEVGALVVAGVALLASALLATPSAVVEGVRPGDLWPFLLAGALVPGASQILFILAVRDAGPSRAAILIGTAALLSVLLALTLLGEPFRPLLVVATALIVAGGAALARERARPEDFRALGVVLALTCAALFGVRDNIVRWAARDTHPPPLVAATASLLAASLVILVYLLVVRRSVLRSRLRSALPAFAVAGVSLGLAYVSLLEAFDRGRVSIVAPLNATQSLWAVVFSAVVVGRRSEVISRRLVLAGALVVAGSALIGAVR
ncbi:MAG: DMT family transporter [Actinobacteria bacterium]|nr:DMT family transporter [Actinomycetota bacterium]